MKKRILSVIIILILMFSLSGCGMVNFNVSELMSPPKATGEKAAIQELIEEEAGSGFTLKYPQNGNYRSSVTTMDFDADNTEEAIVFYVPAGETQTVHMLIMDYADGKWISLGNYASKSSTVDRLVFSDLDGDGVQEIIVGWSTTYNSLINDLSVYLVSEKSSVEITSENKYTDFLCGNFTGGEKEEILLLSLYTTEKNACATLIGLNDTKNSLYSLGETPIDSDVTSFKKLQTGNICDGQFGAVIDGETSEGAYNTQLIYFSDYFESLERVSFTGDSTTNQKVRNYPVLSEDIDGDGIIEIPNTFKMNIDDAQTDAVPAAHIYWCQYNSLGQMTVDKIQAASLVYGCRFTIPDSWHNNYTAYVNYSTNEITFYEWNNSENKLGQSLIIIKMFSHNLWEDGTSAGGYTELTRNDSYVYSFTTVETNSSMLPTNEEIIEAFSLT